MSGAVNRSMGRLHGRKRVGTRPRSPRPARTDAPAGAAGLETYDSRVRVGEPRPPDAVSVVRGTLLPEWRNGRREGFKTPRPGDVTGGGKETSGDAETVVAGLVAGPAENKPPEDPVNPDLARVVAAWETLPDAVKAGVLAMVGASGG
ncbi:hypothetical protein CA12_18320 [Alienimonas californiensis]|uniref:Uncharacterized protein n=1 Tax=Alienimonas californiensis TaxID=2527989 RepID=A0A517P8P1_9PLAN|nr:hypothetical protein CA12_18320 [Alienimonas californiensis]